MARTYSDYMNEISPAELFEGLLGYGLFSDKMPSCLTSVPFYRYCLASLPSFDNDPHQYAFYSTNRNIGGKRLLGIPTPMTYFKLCNVLMRNWARIQTFFEDATSANNFKISQVHLRKIKQSRKLFEMNYPTWRTDDDLEVSLLPSARYLVKADISQCFPSIYTHSLTWALAGGKAIARNQQRNSNVWFNRIDSKTSKVKDGQTHGLLIGPHASNLLSEFILCDVDKRLSNRWKTYIRNIDDYIYYADSLAGAHAFLRDLEQELRSYDLFLNPRKVQIIKMPHPIGEQWVRKVKNLFKDYASRRIKYGDMKNIMDALIDIYNSSDNNASVFLYAMKIILKLSLSLKAQACYKSYIFSLAKSHPYLVPHLGDLVFCKFVTCKSELSNLLIDLYDDGCEEQNFEQVTYSLYYALLCDVEIGSFNIEAALKSEDCLLLLFSYLYCEKFGLSTNLQKLYDYAKTLKPGKSSDFDRMWVFAYEILNEQDLVSDWKKLKRAGVSFINKRW